MKATRAYWATIVCVGAIIFCIIMSVMIASYEKAFMILSACFAIVGGHQSVVYRRHTKGTATIRRRGISALINFFDAVIVLVCGLGIIDWFHVEIPGISYLIYLIGAIFLIVFLGQGIGVGISWFAMLISQRNRKKGNKE